MEWLLRQFKINFGLSPSDLVNVDKREEYSEYLYVMKFDNGIELRPWVRYENKSDVDVPDVNGYDVNDPDSNMLGLDESNMTYGIHIGDLLYGDDCGAGPIFEISSAVGSLYETLNETNEGLEIVMMPSEKYTDDNIGSELRIKANKIDSIKDAIQLASSIKIEKCKEIVRYVK